MIYHNIYIDIGDHMEIHIYIVDGKANDLSSGIDNMYQYIDVHIWEWLCIVYDKHVFLRKKFQKLVCTWDMSNWFYFYIDDYQDDHKANRIYVHMEEEHHMYECILLSQMLPNNIEHHMYVRIYQM